MIKDPKVIITVSMMKRNAKLAFPGSVFKRTKLLLTEILLIRFIEDTII